MQAKGLRRVRAGELLALLGAVCVIVSLFEPWYESPSGNLDAWETFGPGLVLVMLAAAGALVLFLATLTERSTALPVASAVWTFLLGLIAVIAALVRALERPDHATGLCVGAWLALAGTVAILGGTWQSMRDERRSLYAPATPEPSEIGEPRPPAS
ncbi:MAG: hypothetical protein ACLQMH_01315 [Solirubrobacteraceae bacterium]